MVRLAFSDPVIATRYPMLEVAVGILYLLLKFEEHLGLPGEGSVQENMTRLRRVLRQGHMSLMVDTVLIVGDRLLHLLQI